MIKMAREFARGERNVVQVMAVAKGQEELFITLVDATPLNGKERFTPFYTGEFKKDFIFKQALEDVNFKYLAMWVKTNLDQEHNQLGINLCTQLHPYHNVDKYNPSDVKDVKVLMVDKNDKELYVTVIDDDDNTDSRRNNHPIHTGIYPKTYMFRYAIRTGNFAMLAMWVKDNIREDFKHITIELSPSLQKMVRRRGY